MKYLVILFLLLSCCSESVETDPNKCKTEREAMEQVTATYDAHLKVKPSSSASQIIKDTWQARYLKLSQDKTATEVNYKRCMQ